MANKTFNDTLLYNKSSKFNCQDDIAGSKVVNADKFHKIKHCDPHSAGWLKRNRDASRNGKIRTTMISYVYRVSKSRIICYNGKKICDFSIFVVENFAIQKAIVESIQKQLFEMILESDSMIAIQAIKGDISRPSQRRY